VLRYHHDVWPLRTSSDKQRIADDFAVHDPSLPEFGPSWNVAPQSFQPVVRLNRDTGERETSSCDGA
jgi:hypothetical protein